jgi:cell division septation protein DedD
MGPEPKKIHTVPVGPDQVGGAHVAVAGPTAITPPPPARVNPAAVPVARPSLPPAPRVDKGAPLAIVPIAQGAAPPAVAPRSQVARTEERPTPIAAAPAAAAAATGGYAVQVTSQRSEAEAQAAFRELKGKYPDQLGTRQPIIRRADLGDKGTFYRALVGPFGSREQAIQACTSLKAAGGSCIVQGI